MSHSQAGAILVVATLIGAAVEAYVPAGLPLGPSSA
eukprot:CAMPEP_0174946472 /NCGR_PEP_ID=MMETSP1355-20121228/84208_1 /TAXON_ID=464990 /ORGANISM="Hemiselmis tepida, Strain CCMP443" /LENGTH=35 /DNA_ID= /DNA_START= /DNA_END= /DNA_ORIENTATION=